MPDDSKNNQIIEAYDRDGSEPQQVRAITNEYRRRKYFSFRAWYLPPEGGEDYAPGKNGINLPVDEYHEFRKLVDAMDIELGYVPRTTDPFDED
jgi:hypothetical protein